MSPPSGITSISAILPSVSVPVLSNTKCVAAASVSSAWPRVTSTPRRNSVPVAAVSAAGVASDSAHGQVTTSTATVIHSARDGSIAYHARATTAASTSSAPTNQRATRSASCAIFGFSVCARSIRRTMPASTVSCPTRPTRIVSGPFRFTAPPVSASPARFATARDSPVSSDSSTLLSPSTTVPSAGMAAPGRTAT